MFGSHRLLLGVRPFTPGLDATEGNVSSRMLYKRGGRNHMSATLLDSDVDVSGRCFCEFAFARCQRQNVRGRDERGSKFRIKLTFGPNL